MAEVVRPGAPLSYTAPFGEWPNDCNWEDLCVLSERDPRDLVMLDGYSRVHHCVSKGVVVKHFTGNRDDDERVFSTMRLAGDCCVSIIGRVFYNGSPYGICMPFEKAIDSATFTTKEERIRRIYELRDLIAELHAKHIVHGDLKPQNLLLCSDGRLRLCDFDNAALESDNHIATEFTLPYCSPFRMRGHTDVPMTRAEDTYASGLTIWELYTGRTPLLYGGETLEEARSDLESRATVGILPEMALIDDPDIYALIETCLAAGPECPDEVSEYLEPVYYCVETKLEFGLCTAKPRHLYSRIVHGRHCARGDGPCQDPFVNKKVYSTPLDPVCWKCRPDVEYRITS
ncbi:kinase-like domain-containing protein [Mycena crocata]|nr:kinase-like domain-containing protein [Mycena crocata]